MERVITYASNIAVRMLEAIISCQVQPNGDLRGSFQADGLSFLFLISTGSVTITMAASKKAKDIGFVINIIGIVKVELRVKEGKREVHSGHAPLIPNAAWELVWALNATKDRHNRILIEGFSTSVNPPSEEDLKLLAMIPFDPENFRQEYGIKKTLKDGSPQEMLAHLLFTPTANISGMASGYYGEGSKTVIPNEAIAKMDFRLVDGQTSGEAKDKIDRHFESLGLDGLSCEFLGSMEPSKTSPNAPSVKAAIESAREAYGSEPVVWPLLDGSGPLALFTPCLKVPMFVVGLGAPFSRANTHAPNENIGLNEFYRGISFMANYYHRLGKMGR
ncbi:MAG: hypothetical protein PWR28_1377 [Synergistaceae bacterium]|nr:hypothetical protein [Synergistaceae bacterium]